MKDCQLALRTGYYTALNGQLTLNNNVVPVWDRVPTAQRYPYVKLSTQTSTEGQGGKLDCKIQDTTILIDVVTSYDGPQGGKEHSDILSGQILEILTNAKPDLGEGFRIVRLSLENTFDQEDQTPTGWQIRRLIRIRNIVEQITT